MWWLRYSTLASKCCGLWRSKQPTCIWSVVGPAASAAGGVVTWCLIALSPEERLERHSSAHVEASGCCWLEHHGAQRCTIQFLTELNCRVTAVQALSSASVVCVGWLVRDSCTIAPLQLRACRICRRLDVDQARLPVGLLSSCQLSADRRKNGAQEICNLQETNVILSSINFKKCDSIYWLFICFKWSDVKITKSQRMNTIAERAAYCVRHMGTIQPC